MAGKEVRFDIVATDKASKPLDDVADKAEHLEKLDPVVDVGADTRDAKSDVDKFAAQLDKLTDADKLVVLALRAGNAQAELTDIATQLATVDAADPTIDVKVERYAQVADELDNIETKMRDIGGASLDPDPAEKARTRLAQVGEEASRAGDSVHSMAGNVIGDFAATTSGVGPLGEALGQLSEVALAGEGSLRGLASAGLGLGAITGGMLLINTLMGHFQAEAKKAAEIKAFDVKNAKDYADAILAANAALADASKAAEIEGANQRMKDLNAQVAQLVDGWQKAKEIKVFDPVKGEITDILPLLAKAGIGADEYAKAIIEGGQASATLAADAAKAGLTIDQVREITQSAAHEYVNYRDATADASDQTKVFTKTTDTLTDRQRALNAEAQRWQGIADQYQAEVQQTTDKLRGMRDATDDVTSSFDSMSNRISQDQSLINLEGQLSDVATAGRDAMQAQADADKARAAGSKDAADKAAEAASAMRTYRTDVDNAKLAIIEMGKTAGATPVQVDAALNKIDEGDLAGAKADAEAWFRRNPIDAATRLKLMNTITAGVGLPVGTTITVTGTAAAAAGPSVVNQYLARAQSGRELAAVQGRYARINGR